MSAKTQASRFPKRFQRFRKENAPAIFYPQAFPPSVLAVTTDGSVDFALAKSAPFLAMRQQRFLKKHTGYSFQKVFNIKQVHGRRVIGVTKKQYQPQTRIPCADAVMTNHIDLPLAVRTADCLPVFIYDPKSHAISVVHAGWRSTRKWIVTRALARMQKKFGTRAQEVQIVFGPALRACCYEVSREFMSLFPEDVKKKNTRLFFDLAAANARQLVLAGVKPRHIFDCHVCTSCNSGYASYRRDGEKAGRMLSVMMLKNKK